MDSIAFLVSVPDDADTQVKGGFFSSEDLIKRCEIPVEHLRNNLVSVTSQVMQVLQDIKDVGRFKLKEVTLQVEVTAEGGVELIGTAKLGGKGAITLTFAE